MAARDGDATKEGLKGLFEQIESMNKRLEQLELVRQEGVEVIKEKESAIKSLEEQNDLLLAQRDRVTEQKDEALGRELELVNRHQALLGCEGILNTSVQGLHEASTNVLDLRLTYPGQLIQRGSAFLEATFKEGKRSVKLSRTTSPVFKLSCEGLGSVTWVNRSGQDTLHPDSVVEAVTEAARKGNFSTVGAYIEVRADFDGHITAYEMIASALDGDAPWTSVPDTVFLSLCTRNINLPSPHGNKWDNKICVPLVEAIAGEDFEGQPDLDDAFVKLYASSIAQAGMYMREIKGQYCRRIQLEASLLASQAASIEANPMLKDLADQKEHRNPPDCDGEYGTGASRSPPPSSDPPKSTVSPARSTATADTKYMDMVYKS